MKDLGGGLWEFGSVSCGTERLRLICRRLEPWGWDFESLVWENVHEGNQGVRCALTRQDFEEAHTHGRWVSALHSFDPSTGVAIIQVAEYDKPKVKAATAASNVIYSWRAWNLKSNSEVSMLQICKSPFEPYAG